jgi:hypothetical protein
MTTAPSPPPDAKALRLRVVTDVYGHFGKPLVEKLGPKGVAVVGSLLVFVGGGTAAGEATGTFTPVSSTISVAQSVAGAPRQDDEIATIQADVAEIKLALSRLVEQRGGASTQTLRKLLSGARLEKLEITDVNAGQGSGVALALEVKADAGQYIRAETCVVDQLTAPALTISTSTAYTLTLSNTAADGNSHDWTSSSTVSQVNVGSLRGAGSDVTTGGDYDRIVIDGGSQGATIKELRLTRIRLFGAPASISNLKCGALTLSNLVIGDGDGIASADFVIDSTVAANVSSATSTVERAIDVR